MNSINFDYSNQKTQMITNHFHDFCEIYYQLSGEKYYFIKNDTYHILPGDLILIKENLVHKAFAVNDCPSERYLIEMNRHYIKTNMVQLNCSPLFEIFDKEIFVLRLTPNEQNILEHIFREMQKLNKNESLESIIYLKILSLTLQLLLYIYDLNKKERTLDMNRNMFVNKRVGDITHYINSNYMNDLSLETLAAHFNINYYYLCKLFKNTIGFTFSNYLNAIRIKEANHLLLTTSLSITEVAEKVGYTDTSYFGRMYKKIMNTSALKYKKMNKG